MLDPVLVENTRAWLRIVADDLRRAERALAADDFEDCLFHSQQSAEKSLKAFLTWHDQPFSKTHDLTLLAQQCLTLDSSLAPAVENIGCLTPHGVIFRYPIDIPGATKQKASEGKELAHDLAMAVLARLPSETHPHPG